jgi:hypothetical protein
MEMMTQQQQGFIVAPRIAAGGTGNVNGVVEILGPKQVSCANCSIFQSMMGMPFRLEVATFPQLAVNQSRI